MKHGYIKQQLVEWMEGQLSDARYSMIEEHLAECEHCRTYYRTMQQVLEQPQPEQLPKLEADPHLAQRIKAKKRYETPDWNASIFGFSRPVAAMLVTAALILGFFLGLQLNIGTDQTTEYEEYQTITELYYDGLVQPNIGNQYEEVLTTVGGEEE